MLDNKQFYIQIKELNAQLEKMQVELEERNREQKSYVDLKISSEGEISLLREQIEKQNKLIDELESNRLVTSEQETHEGLAMRRLIKTLSKAKTLIEVSGAMNLETKALVESFKRQKVDE